MITNLSEYFLPEQQFYLHKIVYNKLDNVSSVEVLSLNCADNIYTELIGNEEVRVIVTRSLSFDPEEIFQLSVAFGADLKFNPEKRGEHAWNEVNLAEEFRDNGDFVTDHLMSRVTLLIAQITSSYGQQPLILAPKIVKGAR